MNNNPESFSTKSLLNNNVLKNDETLNNYSHTNYFALPNSLPTSFSSYNAFAQNNDSMLVQYDNGILGLSNDNKIIYLTSYSGKIIWAQSLANNSLIKTFCTVNSLNITTLQVKAWSKVFSNNKNWVAFLLTDGSNQAIVTIDLDTGLFVPDNVDNNLVLNGESVFKKISGNSYTKIFQISSNQLILMQGDTLQNAKIITYSNSNSVEITDLTNSNDTSQRIMNFIYAGSKTFALTISTSSSTSNNSTYNFDQYLIPISISNNQISFDQNKKATLENKYFSTNSTLATSITNFKNIFFYKTLANDSIEIIFLSGNDTNNALNIYKYSNGNLTGKNVSLYGRNINSLTYNPNFNKIYIGNNNSNNNIYLEYVDISKENFSATTIQQSTVSSSKKYFLIPVLESKSVEYLIQQNTDNLANPIYIIYNNNSYTNTGTSISLKSWSFVSGNDISTVIGNSYTPQGITIDVVKKYLNLSNISSNISEYKRYTNTEYGTLKLTIKVSYVSSYNSSITSNLYITLYIQNLYKSTDYIFNWLDINSTTDQDKVTKIKELKSSKYANEITKSDIINYFISYTIKNNSGTNITITDSMVNLSYSADYSKLTVSINLTSANLPNGIDKGKINFSHTYTDFLSTSSYTAGIKNNSEISKYCSSIYPSELTNQMIVENLLTTGSGLTNNLSDWTILISDVNDFNGSVTIVASYVTAKNQVKNHGSLPEKFFDSFQNVVNIKITSFKSIYQNKNILNSTPTITNLTSSTSQNPYLPSEIWDQYIQYIDGNSLINQSDVVLLKTLKSNITDSFNLIIDTSSVKVVDSDSSSPSKEYSHGYIQFNISIKDGSKTNIPYTGKQFSSNDGYLVFNENLSSKLSNYPYTIKWEINTYNKYFYLTDKNGNYIISDENNSYSIDLNKTGNTLFNINNREFSNHVTVSDIENLLNIKGYNYKITLENNVNKGYVKAIVNLSLNSKPLVENSNLENNSNFTKVIYIYNFRVPMSKTILLIIILAISLASSILIVLATKIAFSVNKRMKYKKLSKNFEVAKIDKRSKNLKKKTRHFKD